MKVLTYPDSEKQILGACLVDKDVAFKVMQSLTSQHYSLSEHALLHEAMKKIYENQHDITLHSLKMELEKYERTAKIVPYLAELKVHGSKLNLDANIKNVKESFKKLKIAELLKNISSNLDQLSVEKIIDLCFETLDDTEEKITYTFEEIANNFQDGKSYMQVLQERQERFQSGQIVTGISTGFKDLDQALNGINDSFYIIIAGAPGSGKTTFGAQIISNIADQGYKVGIVSLELPREQLFEKLISIHANESQTKLLKGEFDGEKYQSINEKQKIISSRKNIFIEDLSISNLGALKARLRRLIEVYQIDVLFVDYIGLIQSEDDKGSVNEKLTKVSQCIRDMLKHYRIPGLILSQINRNAGNLPPQLHNLRDSGSLGQDAYQVIMLHKEVNEDQTTIEDRRWVYIRKNRQNACTSSQYRFDGIRFYEMVQYNQETAQMIKNVNEESFEYFQPHN